MAKCPRSCCSFSTPLPTLDGSSSHALKFKGQVDRAGAWGLCLSVTSFSLPRASLGDLGGLEEQWLS